MTCLKYNGIVACGGFLEDSFSGFSDLIKSFAGLRRISSDALIKQQKLGVIQGQIHASKHEDHIKFLPNTYSSVIPSHLFLLYLDLITSCKHLTMINC